MTEQIVYGEKPRKCSECGEVRECAAIGRRGAIVCVPCIEDHDTEHTWDEAQARAAHLIWGDPLPERFRR